MKPQYIFTKRLNKSCTVVLMNHWNCGGINGLLISRKRFSGNTLNVPAETQALYTASSREGGDEYSSEASEIDTQGTVCYRIYLRNEAYPVYFDMDKSSNWKILIENCSSAWSTLMQKISFELICGWFHASTEKIWFISYIIF